MGRPRASIEDLRLQGSPNLQRALKYKPQREKTLTPQQVDELEALASDIRRRGAKALALIKKEGVVIQQDKFVRDQLYLVRVPHPALKIAQQCERQLVDLARILATLGGQDSAQGELEALLSGNTQ